MIAAPGGEVTYASLGFGGRPRGFGLSRSRSLGRQRYACPTRAAGSTPCRLAVCWTTRVVTPSASATSRVV